jgi:hypothetical protein
LKPKVNNKISEDSSNKAKVAVVGVSRKDLVHWMFDQSSYKLDLEEKKY